MTFQTSGDNFETVGPVQSNQTGLAEWLEDQDFYEYMQAYRTAPLIDQKRVVDAFEAVKSAILRHVPVETVEQPTIAQLCRELEQIRKLNASLIKQAQTLRSTLMRERAERAKEGNE